MAAGMRYDCHRKRCQLMPQTDLGSTRVPRRRWTIALLLGFGVLVNYFDRVNLSVSRDALEASFGISAVMFGYLSSAYNWTYALLQLPSGLLLDRFGVRRVGIVSTIIWSVASFAADISSLRKSHRLLVSKGRTQPSNRDVRRRREILFGYRDTGVGPRAPAFRMALEFCGHRPDQRWLLCFVQCLLPQPQRRQAPLQR